VISYSKGQVRSQDGTAIGYREYGNGPGLVLVHGGMKAAQDFSKLAEMLAPDFTVYVVDRRGRGMSGPHGDNFGVHREVEDLQAVTAATGARFVFGLSSGALVTLRAARSTPALERIALYEPPLSVRGSVPLAWLPRFHRELAAGHRAAAAITALKGLGTEPVFASLPRFVLTPVLSVAMRASGRGTDEVSIADLVPTHRFDMHIVRELADTAPDYATVRARVLLLDGSKAPAYFRVALDELAAVLPHPQRATLPGLTHTGPEDDGHPPVVAQVLRDFFTAP
jgi:pimeloyl-ACP methyl ester carboxylesterase